MKILFQVIKKQNELTENYLLTSHENAREYCTEHNLLNQTGTMHQRERCMLYYCYFPFSINEVGGRDRYMAVFFWSHSLEQWRSRGKNSRSGTPRPDLALILPARMPKLFPPWSDEITVVLFPGRLPAEVPVGPVYVLPRSQTKPSRLRPRSY